MNLNSQIAPARRCLIAGLFLLFTHGASAQGLGGLLSTPSKAPAAATVPVDPLKRSTPRDSIYNFLESCHTGNLLRAPQYLDLSRIRPQDRAVTGPQLAKQLCTILDRDAQFEVGELSNAPEGAAVDGLPPDLDNLGDFEIKGQKFTLHMQRETQNGAQLWLVSADSVNKIPLLAPTDQDESPLQKYVPKPLVAITLLGTPAWVWIALVLLALTLSALSRALSRIVIWILQPIAARYAKALRDRKMETFTEPLRMLLAVSAFRVCMEFIAPSALVRDYILKLVALLFVLGAASLVMRIVDVISDQILARLDPRQRAMSYSVFPLGVRFVKIFIFCFAVLITLEQWGYNTNTILAGVGVGGLAVALAAQKTIENLFGGISVISDRPVLVGDFCNFGNQVGTIEDIGLRSTRIRTLDRTIVTIPNSQFSTLTLENYSKRDRMWFHPTLHLRRTTTGDQIEQMMDAVTHLLKDHPMVDPTDVPLRFTKIAPDSFSLEIFAYVLTDDFNQFLRVQTELLLSIVKASEAIGIDFAVPFQESIVVESEHTPSGVPKPLQVK